MTHHQPKWRASGGAPLSPARAFAALGGFFLPQDIAVRGAPGDKIDTVLATAPREGGPAYCGTAPRKTFGITRDRHAQLS
jgi:hypothetical protein